MVGLSSFKTAVCRHIRLRGKLVPLGFLFVFCACTPRIIGAGGSKRGYERGPAASAVRLAFAQAPAGSNSAGSPLLTQPRVEIQDSQGNRVTSAAVSITLSLGANPGSGSLSGTVTVDAIDGLASFSGLSINKAGNGYTLRASASGLTSATSPSFQVIAGAASKLAFRIQPAASTVAGDILDTPEVVVKDSQDNLVSSATANVTLSAYTDDLCTIPAPSTPANTPALTGILTVGAISGVADFPGMTLDRAGSHYLKAAAAGLDSDCSSAIQVNPGGEHALAFTTQPGASNVNNLLGPQPEIRAIDPFGNLKSDYTGDVAVTANFDETACDPGKDLPSSTLGTKDIPATNGIASFSDVRITSTRAVRLRASSGGLSVCSDLFSLQAGAPDIGASMLNTIHPVAIANGVSQAVVKVTLRDSYNNIVAGELVSLSSGRNSADSITPLIGLTDSSGDVSFQVTSNTAGDALLTANAIGLASNLTQTATITFFAPTSLEHLVAFQSSTTNVRSPLSGMIYYQGLLYGSARVSLGGHGGVYRLNPRGTEFTVLHEFTGSDGSTPLSNLIEVGGVLFGTTLFGGPDDAGTVFKINPDGTGFQVLHSFNGTDGMGASSALVHLNGELFGVTESGGAGSHGVIFKISTSGANFQYIEPFDFSNTGARPSTTLVALNGDLYGSNVGGGPLGGGVIFRVSPDLASFQKIFDLPTGSYFTQSLIEAGGTLFGITTLGSPLNATQVFKIDSNGTNFAILRNMGDRGTGFNTLSVMDGVLFGTTIGGGTNDKGSLFRINLDGTGFQMLYSFDDSGHAPYAGLTPVNGILYGTTRLTGGTGFDWGTIFRYAP